jgi:TolB protein
MPSWSRRGERIAFTSRRDGPREVYTMAADGTAVTRVTVNGLDEYQPEYSPDDRQLLFVVPVPPTRELYTINVDGTSMTRVNSDAVSPTDADWSVNGREIVFSGIASAQARLYVSTVGVQGERELTTYLGMSPSWGR